MAITIENDRVVRLAYRITDKEGRLLEEKTPEHPYEYLHGRGLINAPVEKALEGKTAGFRVDVFVSPREAYGEYDASLVAEMPRGSFPAGVEVTVGQRFNTLDRQGRTITVRVIDVEDDVVTVDGNHPLAGLEVFFEVRVLDVREATEAEIRTGKPASTVVSATSSFGEPGKIAVKVRRKTH
jgi:FKBP-type peptidyl-prolyl cis-trans isomerase SlyD